ncbi:MAG: S8 family serine peptidase [Actinomycetota bacterium]
MLRGTRFRRLTIVAAGLITAATLSSSAAAAPTRDVDVMGDFIVVMEDSVAAPGAVAADHVRRVGGDISFVYRHAIKGYAATLPVRLVGTLAADPRVVHIEEDGQMSASTTQTNATWGLDRIDQTGKTLDGNFNYVATGTGVTAYIIDTGIRFSHSQLTGRAVSGYDAIDGGSADDCNGHGTHVSGTVGGTTHGVAKAVKLVGVRVLDCAGSGSTSGVIKGVDWVTGNHAAGAPAVANMSLGGGASSSLDTAVKNSIADGVSYAVAAGNGNLLGWAQNACNYSPARVAEAMTIGATDKADKKASWSNYGNCVDWFAPGVSITSAWHTSDTATNTISGTSMATPHVAGVAALYLQGNPAASPAAVRTALYNLTTKGIVTSSSSVNNHLLFTNL